MRGKPGVRHLSGVPGAVGVKGLADGRKEVVCTGSVSVTCTAASGSFLRQQVKPKMFDTKKSNIHIT